MTEASHEQMTGKYVKIFLALIVLTGVTVGVTQFDLAQHGFGEHSNTLLGMAVAVSKASLVAMFFMHLKYEGRVILFVAVFPLLLMAIVMLALMPDIGHWGHPA